MSEIFVLIPGAWHGGWSWRLVAEHLRAAGHRVLTPTLPGLADGDDPTRYGLADAADFIVDLVEREDLRNVTLVAHSWGGYPVTGAAPRLASRLRKIVYFSAFIPAAGVPMIDELPPHFKGLFLEIAAASGNDTVLLPYEAFAGGFMQDAEENVQRLVHSLLVAQPLRYFTETVAPIDPVALGIPVSYVLADEDVSLPPGEWGWLPRFPRRLGDVAVIDTPGSHEAQFTRAAELAETLLKA